MKVLLDSGKSARILEDHFGENRTCADSGEKLSPIIERMSAEAAERADETFTPPTREAWFELHDSMVG